MGTIDSYRREHEGFLQLFFFISILFFSLFYSLFSLSFLLASLPNQTGKMKILLLFVMVAAIMMTTRFQPGEGRAISSQREKSEVADAFLKEFHLDRQKREDSGLGRQKTNCAWMCKLKKSWKGQSRENSDLQN